jgi:quercetin dioxygenase-like cupin family protein
MKKRIAKGVAVFFLATAMIGCSRIIPQTNHKPQQKAMAEVLVKSASSWDASELPAYPEGKPEITIIRVIVPPKTKLSVHEHPVISAIVILKGQLTITTERNQELTINTGDAIVEVVNQWHYAENKSNKPVELIVFYAGVQDEPATINVN